MEGVNFVLLFQNYLERDEKFCSFSFFLYIYLLNGLLDYVAVLTYVCCFFCCCFNCFLLGMVSVEVIILFPVSPVIWKTKSAQKEPSHYYLVGVYEISSWADLPEH